jgi:hypothetical protein
MRSRHPSNRSESPFLLAASAFARQSPVRFGDPNGEGFLDRLGHYVWGFTKTVTYPARHPFETLNAGKSAVEFSAEGFAKTYIAITGNDQQKAYVRNDQPLKRAKERVDNYLQTTSANQASEDIGSFIGAIVFGGEAADFSAAIKVLILTS